MLLALARALCTSLESFCRERGEAERAQQALGCPWSISPHAPGSAGLGKRRHGDIFQAVGNRTEHWDISHTLCQEENGFIVLSPGRDLACRR